MPAATPDQTASVPTDPTAILVNLILAFLAPMFLTVTGGNIAPRSPRRRSDAQNPTAPEPIAT